jgi:hypothetical protein
VLEDDAALLVAVVVAAAVAKSEKVEVRVVIRVCIFFGCSFQVGLFNFYCAKGSIHLLEHC